MTSDDVLDAPDDPKDLRARLDEANRLRAEAEAKAAEASRQVAFRDAGLDPGNKLHQTVMRAYDGDMTADAVRSYVTDLGVLTPSPEPTREDPATPEERAALEAMADASAGDGGPLPDPDLEQKFREDMAAAYNRGARIAEIDAIAEDYSRRRGYQTKASATGQ